SNSLLEGAVVGRAAGRVAAEEAQLRELPHLLTGPHLDPEAPKLQIEDMLYSLKSLMWREVGLVRAESSLAEAVHRIGLWNHYLERSAQHGRRAHELQNMLLNSALISNGPSPAAHTSERIIRAVTTPHGGATSSCAAAPRARCW
ncbi:MAG: hypothetical protein ACO4CZ_18380, partial [Planctomycetota bacterium]